MIIKFFLTVQNVLSRIHLVNTNINIAMTVMITKNISVLM